MNIRCLIALAAVLRVAGQTAKQEPHIHAAQLWFDEGVKEDAQKQFQNAIECFQKAIEIEPTFFDARQALIRTYSASGQPLEEAAAITEYLQIKPDAEQFRIRLGQILLAQRQSEKALAQFSLALKKEPDNADALLGFASAAATLGMQDRALQAMQRGRKRYPSDIRFRTERP